MVLGAFDALGRDFAGLFFSMQISHLRPLYLCAFYHAHLRLPSRGIGTGLPPVPQRMMHENRQPEYPFNPDIGEYNECHGHAFPGRHAARIAKEQDARQGLLNNGKELARHRAGDAGATGLCSGFRRKRRQAVQDVNHQERIMEVYVHRGQGKLQHVIDIGPHRLLTDESPAHGGEDTGPTPHDLLASALAACTALTVTLYARRKEMDLRDVQVRVEHDQQGDAYVLTRHIHYVGDLDAAQRHRLTEIANKCPLHRILTGPIHIVTEEE
jgi:putative redox protein